MARIGEYVLKKMIGQGCYGDVFYGRKLKKPYAQEDMDDDDGDDGDESRYEEMGEYAIKKVNKSTLLKNKRLIGLFKSEVEILKELDHPNLIKCYDVIESESSYYLVLEYCNGGDLESHLVMHKKLPEDEIIFITKQILNGFEELRRLKVMHRDVKLANIFLHNDRVIIGDFGFAKSGIETTTTKLGSPLNMAPEIYLPDGHVTYDSKIDIWSIGIMIYQLHYGRIPWEVENEQELKLMVGKYSGDNLPIPSDGQVSTEMVQLIKSMLEQNPVKRIEWKDLFTHKLFRSDKIRKQSTTLNSKQVSIVPTSVFNEINIERSIPIRPSEGQVNSIFIHNASLLINHREDVKEVGSMMEKKEDVQAEEEQLEIKKEEGEDNIQQPPAKMNYNRKYASSYISSVFESLKLLSYIYQTHRKCMKPYIHLNSMNDADTNEKVFRPSLEYFYLLSCIVGKKMNRYGKYIMKSISDTILLDNECKDIILEDVQDIVSSYNKSYNSIVSIMEDKVKYNNVLLQQCKDICEEGKGMTLEMINNTTETLQLSIFKNLPTILASAGPKYTNKIKEYMIRVSVVMDCEKLIIPLSHTTSISHPTNELTNAGLQNNSKGSINWYKIEQSISNVYSLNAQFDKLLIKYLH